MARKEENILVESLIVDRLPINEATLALVFFLMSGGEVPPIKVQKTKNGFKVQDGRHRVAAHKLLGRTEILARFSTKTNQYEANFKNNIHRPGERKMFNHFGLQQEQSNSKAL